MNFSNWHKKDEKPKILKQFIANCEHNNHFILCYFIKRDFVWTSIGNTDWNTLVNKLHLRYWYYIEDIGGK